jgi:hypothetical protein
MVFEKVSKTGYGRISLGLRRRFPCCCWLWCDRGLRMAASLFVCSFHSRRGVPGKLDVVKDRLPFVSSVDCKDKVDGADSFVETAMIFTAFNVCSFLGTRRS